MYRDRCIPGCFAMLFFLLLNTACTKMNDTVATSDENVSNGKADASSQFGSFTQVNLTANRSGYRALRVDNKLHNAWGMSASPGGTFWVSAADGGVSYVYTNMGVQPIPPVKIPSHVKGVHGNPTGQIFNATTNFIIKKSNQPALFIFASEDGTVSGWNADSGPNAELIIDRSGEGAKYTGLAIANDDSVNYLYVANFTKHKIDVFDKDLNYVSDKPFSDPDIPSGFAPFNIRAINNMLYVTYAFVSEDGEDSTGAGLGYVDVFWPNGSLSKRFATQGTLNAPWGITETSPVLLGGMSAILIGNFGDGHINVFDWDGNYKGQLMSNGKPVAIEGLWAIDNTIAKTSHRQLYFTAGPKDEEDGLFGFLSRL